MSILCYSAKNARKKAKQGFPCTRCAPDGLLWPSGLLGFGYLTPKKHKFLWLVGYFYNRSVYVFTKRLATGSWGPVARTMLSVEKERNACL